MENLSGAWSPLSDNATIQSGGAEHICTTARKWISYFYTFTLLDTFRLLDIDMWIWIHAFQSIYLCGVGVFTCKV